MKLARGRVHVREFARSWDRSYPVDVDPGTVAGRLNDKQDTMLIYFQALKEPPDIFSLLAGDALHNFRSALDHVAWQLAYRALDGSRQPKRTVGFPIVNSPADFHDDRVVTMLAQIDPVHRTMIENLQAYRQPFTHDKVHPLVRLNRLANQDKHRRLHLIRLQLVPPVGLMVNAEHNCVVLGTALVTSPIPAKTYTELGRFYLRATRTGPPNIEFEISVCLRLTLSDGTNVRELLSRIGVYVEKVIDSFEPVFAV